MDKHRRDLMTRRDLALAAGDIAAFQALTLEIAKLPMDGIAPLTQTDIDRYNKRRAS